jgi:predicted PurR-regulated permease PerM
VQICMGTFILTFIGRSYTVWMEDHQTFAQLIHQRDVRRKVLVIGYFVTIALIIGVFGVLTIPYIVREGADFIHRLQAENIWCAPHTALMTASLCVCLGHEAALHTQIVSNQASSLLCSELLRQQLDGSLQRASSP